MTHIYFNATPLLLPKTGIRQYADRLLRQMTLMREISPRYFYLTGWSDELRDSPADAMPFRLWRFKNVVRDLFPASLEIQHRLREKLFKRGLKGVGCGVYHELNFLPFKVDLPTVVTVHDLSVLRFPHAHPSARVRFMEKRLPDAVRNSAFVLTDSEYVRKEVIAEYSVPEHKVITVLLAASETYRPQGADICTPILAQYGLSYKKYLLAVGTVEPRKNLVTAIKAFTAMPDRLRQEYHLVLAGMRGWENDELDGLLKPLIHRGEVKVLGYVPDDALPILYSGATAMVYPSLYEGFGLPPLEAMACGTPVITSNRASLPEVVGDAGITVDAFDVDGLRNVMNRLIEDPDERDRLSRQGLLRSGLFSWERTAEATAAVYRMAAQA